MKLEQQKEIDKYSRIYSTVPRYKMSGTRGDEARQDLRSLNQSGSYLDVGCGRGEMLLYAKEIGFTYVEGTETVPMLYERRGVQFALATDLPYLDDAFDVVSCLDVLEHLLPEDTEKALQELSRVAKNVLFLTANNKPSNSLGVELHINRRPYEEWDALIKANCGGDVVWVNRKNSVSETWLVYYD